MKDLVIVGAGGFGREVAWLIERLNDADPQWNVLGWIDDTPAKQHSTIAGYPVLGGVDVVTKFADASLVCAIGSADARRTTIARIEEQAVDAPVYATLIDPSVLMSRRVEIGSGSIICAGTVITVDVTIGCHVIVNLDCTIGHDAVLDDYVTLYPSVNVSGNTRLGERVEMGTGSRTIQGRTVGHGTILGAGSTVVRDLPPNCTAVGSPAVPIKLRDGN